MKNILDSHQLSEFEKVFPLNFGQKNFVDILKKLNLNVCQSLP